MHASLLAKTTFSHDYTANATYTLYLTVRPDAFRSNFNQLRLHECWKSGSFLGGEKSGGSLQSESKSIRDSRSAQGLLIGGRCNTCNESASARRGFSLMSENPSCPWKASGTLSHVCAAHIAGEFWEKALCIEWGERGEVSACICSHFYINSFCHPFALARVVLILLCAWAFNCIELLGLASDASLRNANA